jgi:nitrite reductase (NAD(P)H)
VSAPHQKHAMPAYQCKITYSFDPGCGGCIPLVTKLFQMEMKKAGIAANNNLCSHFAMSRADLFNVVKFVYSSLFSSFGFFPFLLCSCARGHLHRIKRLEDFPSIMAAVGTKPDSVGCETCKPTIGSILSSLYNEHVMKPIHHQNQETNDKLRVNSQSTKTSRGRKWSLTSFSYRYLANIQRNGTFSVVPRVSAGEITPDGLIAIGQVAKKCLG